MDGETPAAANGPRKGAAGFLGGESFERSLHEARQRLELVAALEHGRDARRHRRAAARELAEPLLADAHVRQRVVVVRVEAGRHEYEVRLEPRDGGLDQLVERAHVLVVARAGGQRHVQRRLALVVGAAGTGIERPLVQRHEENTVVVLEHRFRPIAVMHVVVDNRDALQAENKTKFFILFFLDENKFLMPVLNILLIAAIE